MKHLFFEGLLIVLLVIGMGSISVKAQDGGEIACTANDLQAAIDTASGLLEQAKTANGQDAIDLLIQAHDTLAATNIACTGMNMEDDAATLYDPVYIPEGMYRVTATTEGYFIMDALLLDGECVTDYMMDDSFSAFILMQGQATTGAEELLKSKGCTVIWQTSNVSAPYTVTFEKIG